MKLIIFGATGRLGVHLVRQALAGGHSVTAFVRNAAKAASVLPTHAGLAFVTGDVKDAAAVSAAIAGHGAVLFALGHVYGETDASWMTAVTRAILAGMQAHGVKRLVDITGVVNPEPRDGTNVVYSIMRGYLTLFKKTVLADHEARTAVIKAAPREAVVWTIVRPPILTDGPLTARYHVAEHASLVGTGSHVSRADVAHFMLAAISDDTWAFKLPIISY
jgi:putative NADH-flavin reductase